MTLDKNWHYQPDTRLKVFRHFNDFFYYGGFAESFEKQNKREWLTSLYQKILMGDIVERNKVRNPLVSPLTEQQTIMKRYFADNGILNNFLFQGETKLLENMVAVHLNKLYHNTKEELRLFYYNKGVEVDFCVPESNLAIQVSFKIDDADTYDREVGGLVKFLKTFKDYRGVIVTWDTEKSIQEDGITIDVVPVWKWLLI